MSPSLQATAATGRSLFDRRAFTTLVRAMHPERRSGTTTSRLTVGELDRQPDVATAWVYGAYATVLGRLPDPGGLVTHEGLLRGGGTPEELVDRLTVSPEAEGVLLDGPVPLHHVFVTGAYLVVFGRRPDMAGLHAYVDALRSGADTEEVLNSLLRSPEARVQLRFPPAPPSTDDELARAVQRVVMGDVDPGVDRLLRTGRRAGRSTVWMVWTTVRRRGGRRRTLRALPGVMALARRSRREAADAWDAAAFAAGCEWNWRVQRRLMDDAARLSREVAELQRTIRQS